MSNFLIRISIIMKINASVLVLSLFCFSLVAQVDKTAITTDFINGWTTDKKHETIKKHFSPNITFTWANGGIWPDGSDGSLDNFWTFYTSHSKQYSSEITKLDVRELDNETYAFFSWSATVIEDEDNPRWVGTTAKGPGVYRIIWQDNKIKHLYFYADMKSREAQHEEQAKKK